MVSEITAIKERSNGSTVYFMKTKSLSLVHQIRRPTVNSSQKPPLLLMLHSIYSNEESLISYAQMLDSQFFIVSARAPILLAPNAHAWFPIKLSRDEKSFLLEDVEKCRFLLMHFIAELIDSYDLDSRQLYLMGFSQGAVMSFSLALTIPSKISGVVAMSGRIESATLDEMDKRGLIDFSGIEKLPIFVAHGQDDQMIPIRYGRETCDHLKALKVNLKYVEYSTGHKLDDIIVKDGGDWLTSQLSFNTQKRLGTSFPSLKNI